MAKSKRDTEIIAYRKILEQRSKNVKQAAKSAHKETKKETKQERGLSLFSLLGLLPKPAPKPAPTAAKKIVKQTRRVSKGFSGLPTWLKVATIYLAYRSIKNATRKDREKRDLKEARRFLSNLRSGDYNKK